MNSVEELFLQALCASLKNESVKFEKPLSIDERNELLKLSEVHSVTPLIYDAVYKAKNTDKTLMELFKISSVQKITAQVVKTDYFTKLYNHLVKAGLTPVVVKGIVCRSLFPNPDYRISSDEDILIPEEQFSLCCEAMTNFGMSVLDPDEDIDSSYEVTFYSHSFPLRIELHKHLFSPQSTAVGDFNRFFEDSFKNIIELQLQGTTVYTMNHTDNMFYLICHSFKHFLHSGFGIRQVCDITLYANTYGKYIDWQKVLENCREIKADLFAAAIFKIGEKHLTFNSEKACYSSQWKSIKVDDSPLLEDLLLGGVYGGSTMNRKHSSSITLNAVSSERQGKSSKKNIVRSVFLPLKDMKKRYKYLKTAPYLLPVAYFDRIVKYRLEINKTENNSVTETIKIGRDRIELLKKYDIIK